MIIESIKKRKLSARNVASIKYSKYRYSSNVNDIQNNLCVKSINKCFDIAQCNYEVTSVVNTTKTLTSKM